MHTGRSLKPFVLGLSAAQLTATLWPVDVRCIGRLPSMKQFLLFKNSINGRVPSAKHFLSIHSCKVCLLMFNYGNLETIMSWCGCVRDRRLQPSQVLCFRNNDSVNRRLKLLPLDSPHFSISGPRSPHKLKALKQTKVEKTGQKRRQIRVD